MPRHSNLPARRLAPSPLRPTASGGLPLHRGSDANSSFLVSGTTHRQDALARCSLDPTVFRLVAEPTNRHDPNAVKVMYEGRIHIGYITAKTAPRYQRLVLDYAASGGEYGCTDRSSLTARVVRKPAMPIS
jgi:hypothetical protein